jgi:glycine betaine/proline transport system ATP-binding protein
VFSGAYFPFALMALIDVRGLTKVFGDDVEAGLQKLDAGADKDAILRETGCTVAVRDASFTVEAGETFVVMGRSGSGKSTLLRCLNRLVTPTRGAIEIDGEDVVRMSSERLRAVCRARLAMVFQQFGLLPHRSVAGNVGFGLEVRGVDADERRRRVEAAIRQVGLDGYADQMPDALSGGMQQRVGLARALATDPDILLMDEPFSALDPLIRTELQDELMRLQNEQRRTVVFITHDVDEAFRLADRLAIMEAGRIVQTGAPVDVLAHPATDYVRDFVADVDRTRALTAGDVATPVPEAATGPDGSSPTATVPADAALGIVLARVLRDGPHAVTDGDGQILGHLTPDAIARVLDASGD